MKSANVTFPILLIGFGNMGKAILTGLLRTELTAPIYVKTRTEEAAQAGRETFKTVTFFHHYQDLQDLHNVTVICAVKPVAMRSSVEEMFEYIKPLIDPIFISVIAGVKIRTFQSLLPLGVKIIRVMPNTPCEVGEGFLSAYAEETVTDAVKAQIAYIFSGCGKIAFLEQEAHMSPATALAGSGPAYVFHFVEALTKAGEAAGLSAEFAAEAAKQTVIGAVELMKLSSDTPEALRKKVTSPNGTTQTGLEKLMNKNLSPDHGKLVDLMTETIKAAALRSEMISAEIEKP